MTFYEGMAMGFVIGVLYSTFVIKIRLMLED